MFFVTNTGHKKSALKHSEEKFEYSQKINFLGSSDLNAVFITE